MQTLINMGMIWSIELFLSVSPTRRLARPLLDLTRLCSFCNEMSISPQTVSLAHILDGYLFLGPHSQPIHPPLPHPWGQLGCWSWCQTSIYFKLLRLIWRCIYDPHLNEGDIPFDLQVCCKFIEQRLQTRVGVAPQLLLNTLFYLYTLYRSPNISKNYSEYSEN